jgi:hypothetical protein
MNEPLPRTIELPGFVLGVVAVFVLHTMWACFVYRDQPTESPSFWFNLYSIYLPVVLAYAAFRELLASWGLKRWPSILVALALAFLSLTLSTFVPATFYRPAPSSL